MNSSSGWIKGMKFFAWLAFFLICGSGLAVGLNFLDNENLIGILFIAGGFIVAFMSVAIIMIFLDMAEDIKDIRYNIQNKKERTNDWGFLESKEDEET